MFQADVSMDEKKLIPIVPPSEKVGNESDLSSDSSTSRKQLKSPHTLLKSSSSKSTDKKYSDNLRPTQSDHPSEQYVLMLKETEQSLANRDTLVTMLQGQLKKIANLYKQSLDDTEDLRFKYCLTAQELNNLRTICAKYKEEIESLVKEKDANDGSKDIQKLQKETENWKTQYEELLQQVESQDKPSEKAETISKEIQSELTEIDADIKGYIDILNDRYNNIQYSLQDQNQKLELLLGRLEPDLKQSENQNLEHDHVSMENLNTENAKLKQELTDLKNDYDSLKQLLHSNNSDKSINNEESELLKNIVGNNIDRESASCCATLQKEIEAEVYSLKLSTNECLTFKQCACDNKETANTTTESNDTRSKRDSKVSFLGGNNHLQELVEVSKENSRLKLVIKEMQGDKRRSDELEKCSVNNINLCKQLKQAEEEIERLTQELKLIQETKHNNIEQLQQQEMLLRNDYDDLLKAHDLLQNNVKNQSDEISEKEATIESLRKQIEVLNTKLDCCNNNSEVLEDELQKLKETISEHNDKIEKLNEKDTEINNLQVKMDKLTVMLAKSQEENEQCNKELLHHASCSDKINELEAELSKSNQTINELEHHNHTLACQIDGMTKNLQQYKEEAEFKKMENEKLRRKEEQLQSAITNSRRNSENREKQYNQELENSKAVISQICKEYTEFQNSCKCELEKDKEEKDKIEELLNAKVKEIEKLQNTIALLTRELDTIKALHDKNTNDHDKSLSEITCLYKNKEDELLAIDKELKEQQEYLKQLEEENSTLKNQLEEKSKKEKLLQEITQPQEIQNTAANNQITDLNFLEESCRNEKITNCNLKCQLEKTRKDLDDLKLQFRDLVKNLEHKLMQLKTETEKGACCLSAASIKEMLKYLGRFNTNALQSTNGSNTEETENALYCFEEAKLGDMDTEDGKYKNATTSSRDLSPPINTTKCSQCQTVSNTSITDLLTRREFLVEKVRSIDEKLNILKNASSLTTNNSSQLKSECSTSSSINISEKYAQCECEQPREKLLFKRKYYSEKINDIDKKLKSNGNTDSNTDKACNTTLNKCPSMNTYWKKNLQIIQQIALDVNEMKIGFAATASQHKSTEECNLLACPLTKSLQVINNFQQQVDTTNSITTKINKLETQLEEIHNSKMQECITPLLQQCETNKHSRSSSPRPSVLNENSSCKASCKQIETTVQSTAVENSLGEAKCKQTETTVQSRNQKHSSPKLSVVCSIKNSCNNKEMKKLEQYGNKKDVQHNAKENIKKDVGVISALPVPLQNSQRGNNFKYSTNLSSEGKPNSDNSCAKKCKLINSEQKQQEIAAKVLEDKITKTQFNSNPRCTCVQPSKPRFSQSKPIPQITTDPLNNVKCICGSNPHQEICRSYMKMSKNK